MIGVPFSSLTIPLILVCEKRKIEHKNNTAVNLIFKSIIEVYN